MKTTTFIGLTLFAFFLAFVVASGLMIGTQQEAANLPTAEEGARAKNFGTTPEALGAIREELGRAGVSNEGFNALVDNLSRQVKEDYPDMMENIRTDAATRDAAERRLREAEENLRRAYSR